MGTDLGLGSVDDRPEVVHVGEVELVLALAKEVRPQVGAEVEAQRAHVRCRQLCHGHPGVIAQMQ